MIDRRSQQVNGGSHSPLATHVPDMFQGNMDVTTYASGIKGITFTCWRCAKETYLTSAQVMAMAEPGEDFYAFRRRYWCECGVTGHKVQTKYAGVEIGTYGRRSAASRGE